MEIYEHLNPIMIVKIYSFNEKEKLELLEYLKKLIKFTTQKEQHINLYIDLYNMNEYTLGEIYGIISYLVNFSEKEFKYFNKLTLFINENMNWLLKKILSGITLRIPFEIIYLKKEKIWKE